MSTIGANVQLIPAADASSAATCADFFMASISQLAASASGIGLMVLYPCITSKPMISGIPNLDSSTTIF